jgi:pimeloyl-ACP methyl ester carboxylesterase
MTGVAVHELAPGRTGGPLVVLAHGMEDSWRGWLPLAGRLPAHWRVVALDLPWRAGNDYAWRRRSSSGQYLAEALDLVDAVPDALVAHSYGANATLELAAGRGYPLPPEAVLLCPLYRPPETPVSWQVFDRSRRNFDRHIRDGVRVRLGGRAARMEPDVLESMMIKTLARVGPAGFLTAFDAFVASADLPLRQLPLSALILAGGADPTLSMRAAGALGEAMAATVVVEPDYDHFCHVRRPAAVAGRIVDFLASAGSAARTTTNGAR